MSEADYAEALRQGALNFAIMIEVDHPDGFVYAWSGIGILTYEGQDYQGLGTLLAVSEIESTVEVEVTEITLSLSGVDPDLLEGLSSSVKGRTGSLYEAWLDRHYRVVHRRLMADVRLDVQHYAVGEDGRARIDLVCQGGMYHLLNRSAARWSSEDQKSLYPDDTGFDEMHLQENLDITWRAE